MLVPACPVFSFSFGSCVVLCVVFLCGALYGVLCGALCVVLLYGAPV